MDPVRITDEDVENAVAYAPLIDALRDAFESYAVGDTSMPAKTYVDLPEHNGDFRSMPAHVKTTDWEAVGVKWVNVHPNNDVLPTVMATLMYNDPATGEPLALFDATTLTGIRTGAVAALATDYLAVTDATSLGVIGAGEQAYRQVDAISTIRPIDHLVVSDVDDERQQAFVDAYDEDYTVEAGDVEDAAGCDVLSTITPVKDPLVPRSALSDHTHVNAMGADAEGKQELDPHILQDAIVVIDDWEQATHSGEVNVPYREGVLTDGDIEGTLGEVAADCGSVTIDAEDLTVFDSTGLAIQDICAAHIAYLSLCSQD